MKNKINNLPTLGLPLNATDKELKTFIKLMSIFMSGSYSYGWRRGKYGTVTEHSTQKTYKIKQEDYERIQTLLYKPNHKLLRSQIEHFLTAKSELRKRAGLTTQKSIQLCATAMYKYMRKNKMIARDLLPYHVFEKAFNELYPTNTILNKIIYGK